MLENIDIKKLRQDAVSDIKETIRNNSKFLHPCNKEKLEYQKKLKFENGYDFTVWMQQNGIMKNPAHIYRKQKEKTATNAGFNNYKEYIDDFFKKKGMSLNEYKNQWRYDKGERGILSKIEGSAQFTGVYIGEINIGDPVLVEIFGSINQKMSYTNIWFDRVVKGDHKVDVKTSYLHIDENAYKFHINYNNIADYFLLVALENKIVAHIWLFKKDDYVRKRKFYQFETFKIMNEDKYLNDLKSYEWTEKLACIKEIQKNLDMNI